MIPEDIKLLFASYVSRWPLGIQSELQKDMEYAYSLSLQALEKLREDLKEMTEYGMEKRQLLMDQIETTVKLNNDNFLLTQEIEKKEKEIADMKTAFDEIYLKSNEHKLHCEIAELKAWKESAMSVMSPMQEIGKALGVKLGESIHDKILPGIERLKGLIEKIYKDAGKVAKHYWSETDIEGDWQQFKTKNQL